MCFNSMQGGRGFFRLHMWQIGGHAQKVPTHELMSMVARQNDVT